MLTDCVSVEFFVFKRRSYLLSLDLISFHCIACMLATPVPGARLAAEKLRGGKYSAIYQRRLLEGGRSLEAFLHEAGLDWTIIKREKAKRVDEILEQYIRQMHSKDKRSSLRLAKHAVLMVQITRPRLRKSLQTAWNSIKSWEEQRPSNFRPPLPIPLLVAMVCKARIFAQNSRGPERVLWHVFATLLMVGFFGMLRPGEIFNLRPGDINLANSLSLCSGFAVLRIARPKNAHQMGAQQCVERRHPDAMNWLAWLKNRGHSQESAGWPSNPTKFRNLFSRVCQSLNISQLRLSPGSLRAGGATWLIDEGFEVSRVRFMGRWAHLRSLEHYIQVARAQQIALSIPASTAESLTSFLLQHMFLLVLPVIFRSQVSSVHLVLSEVFTPVSSSHVVTAARSWGRLDETVQEGHGRWRPPQRGKIQ